MWCHGPTTLALPCTELAVTIVLVCVEERFILGRTKEEQEEMDNIFNKENIETDFPRNKTETVTIASLNQKSGRNCQSHFKVYSSKHD